MCDGPNDQSAEDAIPRWVLKHLRSSNPEVKWTSSSGIGKPQVNQEGLRRVRTWHVCGTCNAFLNSNLENKARDHLRPLIDGTECVIEVATQAIIAGWVFKTAVMLARSNFDADWHPPDYALRHLRAVARPPGSAFVWIGTTSDIQPTGFTTHPRPLTVDQMWAYLPNVTVPNRTFATTFVIGHLVGHILVPHGIPNRLGRPPDLDLDDWMVRVWPLQPDAATWPSPNSFQYGHLHTLVGRYRWHGRALDGRTFRQPVRY